MPSEVSRIPGHSAKALCFAGIFILAVGIAAAYVLRAESSVISQDERFRFVLMLTFPAAGICFIAATAKFWMRH